MTHCTVCGAAAREGAKFCTSCGARLMDTTSSAAPAEEIVPLAPPVEAVEATATMPAVTGADEEPSTETPDETLPEAPASTDTDPDAADATTLYTGPESPSADVPEQGPAEPEYASNWPATDPADEAAGETLDADSAPEPVAEATAGWETWSATAEDATATPDDIDVTTEEATEEPVAMTESTGVAAEDDHHGASQWESWAPAADATPTVATGSSDTAASVRRLLDDLANRIDRLIAPATLASREVDPDSLAEQLDRWSRPAPGSDDLLAAVQAVRKSPRDIDAVTRLADRAADLELLVRHYQAITTGSAKWAAELRQQKEPSGDES